MDKPNYVLKTNEAVLMPIENNNTANIIKICVWIIVGIIVLGSILFQENLFSELSWTARIMLIVVAVGFGFYDGKKEYCPSPMELQFYDEYLVLYLPKRYYSKRVTRKQINTMKYADISKCAFKAKSNRIHIYGNGTSVWYNYKKDGSLPENPTESRTFTQGLIYFNTSLASDVDFIREIETNSPLHVVVEND